MNNCRQPFLSNTSSQGRLPLFSMEICDKNIGILREMYLFCVIRLDINDPLRGSCLIYFMAQCSHIMNTLLVVNIKIWKML